MTATNNYNLLTDITLDETIQSDGYNLLNIETFCIQAVVTAAASIVGAFKIQLSNDNTNWTDVASSSQAVSTDGTFAWNVEHAGYLWVRLVFTYTSGDATGNAVINSKGF